MTQHIDPKTLTIDLGGKWLRSYGAAPCPCCQPERRKNQNALTIAERGGRLLLHCKKAGCDFTDLLSACGVKAGGLEIDFEAVQRLSLIHISEPTRLVHSSRMPSSA